jgi:hypothetical protein
VRNIDHPVVWRVHEVYLFLAVLVTPTLIMSWSYGHIIREVTAVVKQRKMMTQSYSMVRHKPDREEEQLAR